MWWTKRRAIVQFKRQFPNVPIVKWEYVSSESNDLVRIYTDKETLTVQYDPARKQSMIVGMTE